MGDKKGMAEEIKGLLSVDFDRFAENMATAMKNKGNQTVRHVTINGEWTIMRRAYGSRRSGMVCPADGLLGITQHTVSVGVRERCSQESLDRLFSNGVRSLKTLGQIRLSEDRVRRIVESEGQRV